MGIQGLLQILRPITEDKHISDFKGQTAAVDALNWIYKGAFSCALKLGLDFFTFEYMRFPLKMIQLLENYGIKPILVFDGMSLPVKEKTERARAESKKDSRQQANELVKLGRIEEATKYFEKSMYIKTGMLYDFVDVIKAMGIEYIIAPFESDAQIAYLVRQGIADFAISEDSDLIAYGCPRTVLKLQLYNGSAKFINLEKLTNAIALNVTDATIRQMSRLSLPQFTQLCILSGCDYLPSLTGVALKTALKLMNECGEIEKIVEKLKCKKSSKKCIIPSTYIQDVKDIQSIFFHQCVYDPLEKKLRPLREPGEGVIIEQPKINGKPLKNELLQSFIKGNINKRTFERRNTVDHLDVRRIKSDLKTNMLNDCSFSDVKTQLGRSENHDFNKYLASLISKSQDGVSESERSNEMKAKFEADYNYLKSKGNPASDEEDEEIDYELENIKKDISSQDKKGAFKQSSNIIQINSRISSVKNYTESDEVLKEVSSETNRCVVMKTFTMGETFSSFHKIEAPRSNDSKSYTLEDVEWICPFQLKGDAIEGAQLFSAFQNPSQPPLSNILMSKNAGIIETLPKRKASSELKDPLDDPFSQYGLFNFFEKSSKRQKTEDWD